jgi:Protein of unknown function (DUF3034)
MHVIRGDIPDRFKTNSSLLNLITPRTRNMSVNNKVSSGEQMFIKQKKLALRLAVLSAVAVVAASVHAQTQAPAAVAPGFSGKLLATGGVSQVEGAGGGGLSVWSLIGGYGTREQWGGTTHVTHVRLNDYSLNSAGVTVGLFDRVELSIAQQAFNTKKIGAALGLGAGYTFRQDTFGAKFRLVGDAVYDQDRLMPQIAVGLQHKRNRNGDVLKALGAKSDSSTDFYASATKVYLDQRVLLSAALRLTKANQLGILGFGGPEGNRYRPQFEGSVCFLLRPDLVIGFEGRSKRDYLRLGEQAAYDAFVAYFPNKHLSFTLAYVDLGKIVIPGKQRGGYLSAQLSF